jgi:hypothetical protein
MVPYTLLSCKSLTKSLGVIFYYKSILGSWIQPAYLSVWNSRPGEQRRGAVAQSGTGVSNPGSLVSSLILVTT